MEHRTRKKDCPHPWYQLQASITGLVCTQCGTTWPSGAANVVWMSTLAAINDLGRQLEQLQSALFNHLDMTSCDHCGAFFPAKPLAIHGIKTTHFSLCRDCILPGYHCLTVGDAEAEAELLDAIARWFYRHRQEIPRPFPQRNLETLVGDRLVVLAQTDGLHTRLPPGGGSE
jgi:hypothetical protein